MTRLATIPSGYEKVPKQDVEYCDECAGIFFRSIVIEKAGMIAGYHSHDYAHASYIGSGAARLYFDGVLQGDHVAGESVEIPANVAHSWEALQDNTRIACVHRSEDAMKGGA